ncbi:hypothetical protein HOP50_15g76170 [Chloropicon primus]|nr:hypothetical protein A3770_15p75890 [Chloropicon primus]UPR04280.1 hypothetical protein HOP50_15g76170 [Chloropicon primus]|eukprot:QDZ25071.1 hypothetical protein A3770_15p75890 [Chloropicon primus]
MMERMDVDKVRASGEVDVFGKKRNPFVLVGALATAGVLFGGITAFRRGNKALSQNMMKARVVCQGVTVALMVATSGVLGSDKALFQETWKSWTGDTQGKK